jgi:hypothetical protein
MASPDGEATSEFVAVNRLCILRRELVSAVERQWSRLPPLHWPGDTGRRPPSAVPPAAAASSECTHFVADPTYFPAKARSQCW